MGAGGGAHHRDCMSLALALGVLCLISQTTLAHVLSASKFTELSENANHFSDFSELESLAEAGKEAQAAEPLKASDNITEKAGARPENAAKPVEGAEEEVDVTEENFSPQVERVVGLVTFCCVVVIIMLTIFFDFGREKLIESTESTPLNPVVHSLFGELAILGFIALLSFMATSAMVFKCAAAATKPDCSAMTFLSLKVFGHIFKSEEEAMTALPEVFERLHFVVFGIMLLFLFIVVSTVAYAKWQMGKYKELELWCHEAINLLKEIELDPKNDKLNAEIAALHRKAPDGAIPYYYLRKNFINSAKRTVYFDFQTYLYERLGKVYCEIVEIPARTWFSVIVLGAGVLASGYQDKYVPLWVTIAMSYLLIVVGVVCSHKLSTILAQLSPAKMDNATMFELAPLHTSGEVRLFGKEVGPGYHEPPYRLLPAPSKKDKIPSKQAQLWWFSNYSWGRQDLMQWILSTQLLLTSAYATIFLAYLTLPLTHSQWLGFPKAWAHVASAVLVPIALFPILPSIWLFAGSVMKFTIATAIEELFDKKLGAIIERRCKSARALDRLRRLSSLKVLTGKTKSKMTGEKVEIPPAVRKDMSDLFAQMDEDNGGTVTKQELKHKFQDPNFIFHMDDAQLETTLKLMAPPGVEQITRDEFIEVMATLSSGEAMNDEEFVDMLFGLVDKDGSGEMEIDEFNNLLQQSGQDWDLKDIDELFREVDTDRSGQIDKEEFLDFIKKANAEAS